MTNEVLTALYNHDIQLVRKLTKPEPEKKTKLIDLHWRNSNTVKKKCVICGAEFETKRKNQVYCSHECNNKARRIRAKAASDDAKESKKLPTAKCKMCGREFAQVNKNHVFCSKKCVDEWHGRPLLRKRYDTPEDMKGQCERCSRPAVPGMSLCEHHLELQQRLHG